MKNTVRNLAIILISLAVTFIASTSVWASSITIKTKAELESYSTKSGSTGENSILTLNPGNYDMPSSNYEINISRPPYWDTFVIGSNKEEIDTVLTIGSEGSHTDDVLYSRNIEVNESGKLVAVGGMHNSVEGIFAWGNIIQKGGIISAKGGNGWLASGIDAFNLTQQDGVIYAYGSEKGSGSDGILVNRATQYDGTIFASGGSAEDGAGIGVGNKFEQIGGIIFAKGGTGESSEGIAVGNEFLQSGGIIFISGGAGKESYGIRVRTPNAGAFNQSAGTIYVKSGSGEDASGIYAYKTMSFAGSLILQPGGNAASVMIKDEWGLTTLNNLTFRRSARLIIEVNDEDLVIGKIEVTTGNTNIITGAQVIVDDRQVSSKAQYEAVFLENKKGTISGTFNEGNTTTETLTYKFVLNKSSDNKKYSFNYHRKYTPDELVEENNAKALVAGLFKSNVTLAQLEEIQYNLDNFGVNERSKFDAYVEELSKNLIPYEAANLANFGMDQIYLLRAQAIQDISSNSSEGIGISVKPLLQVGKDEDISQNILGGELGFKFNINGYKGNLSVHYLNGHRSDSVIETDAHTFGVALKNSYSLKISNQQFSASLILGYDYQKISSSRKAFDEKLYGETNGNIFNAALILSDSIEISKIIIAPRISMDYAFISLGDYEEYGGDINALSINFEDYNSLRIGVGINVSFEITKDFCIQADVEYGYDILNRSLVLNNTFLADPEVAFETEGEAAPHSGAATISGIYNINKTVSLGADLGVNFHGSYIGFSADLKVGISF